MAKFSYAISPDTGLNKADRYTTGNTNHALVFTGTGLASDSITISWMQPGSATAKTATTKVASNGSWSITTPTLPDGAYNFSIKETGKQPASVTVPTWTLDTKTSVSITGIGPDVGLSPTDGITKGGLPQTISGTAEAGDVVLVTYVEAMGGKGILGTAVADSSGAWCVKAPAAPDGTYTLTALATDKAGNIATSTYKAVLDTIAPSAPTLTVKDSNGGVVTSTTDTVLHVSGAAEANSLVIVSWKDAGGLTGILTSTAGPNGTWAVDTNKLALGSYTFTATATDAAGNASKASAAYNVNVAAPPNTAPVGTDKTVAVTEDTGSASVDLNTMFSDPDKDTLTFAFTGPADGPAVAVKNATSFNLDTNDPFFATLNDGQHQTLAYKITADDGHGHQTTKTLTFDLTGHTDYPIAGRVIDGYIAHALVFRDENGNGVLDNGELQTHTDAQGNFVLPAGPGQLVAMGEPDSLDIATGVAFKGTLTAPEGSTVVTPLTTLVNELVKSTGVSITLDEAEHMVQVALGLDTTVNLLTADPYLAAKQGDLSAYAAGVGVYNTLALVGSSGGSVDAALGQLAKEVVSLSPGQILDLTSRETVQAVVAAAGVSAPTAVVSSIVQTNIAVEQAINSGQDTGNVLADVAAAAAEAQASNLIHVGASTPPGSFIGGTGIDTLVIDRLLITHENTGAVILLDKPSLVSESNGGFDYPSDIHGSQLNGSTISDIENLVVRSINDEDAPNASSLIVGGTQGNNTLEITGPGASEPKSASYLEVWSLGGNDTVVVDHYYSLFIYADTGDDHVVLGDNYSYSQIADVLEYNRPSGNDIYDLGIGRDNIHFFTAGTGTDVVRGFTKDQDMIAISGDQALISSVSYQQGHTLIAFQDGGSVDVDATIVKHYDAEAGSFFWY